MPEWIGTILFLLAMGLTAIKIVPEFGNNGLRGYAFLLLMTIIYAAAIGIAYA